MLKILVDLYQSWKFSRAAAQTSSGDSCAACDTTNVTLLGPAAYRCEDCGYEGGDGWAAYARSERDKSFATMAPEDRRASARQNLLDARRLLLSGRGDLQRATAMGAIDLMGIGGTGNAGFAGEGGEKYSELTTAMGLLMEAQDNIRDAFAKLYGSADDDNSADVTPPAYALAAVDLYFDNAVVDIAFLGKVHSLNSQASELVDVVNKALEQEFKIRPHDNARS